MTEITTVSPRAEPVRCLVLGGLGFIGSHLIDALLARGHHVRCFDRPHVQPLEHQHAMHPLFERCEGDFASEADVARAVEGCSVCFHLVSTTLPQSSNADPVFDVESNVVGTLSLLKHAVRSGMKKIVFVSSGGTVYGTPLETPIPESHPTQPVCSYGITKLAIEKYLHLYHHLHGLDYAVLRLANPYGERQRTHASQGAVAVFTGKVLRGEVIEIWGDGSVVRDYIYIEDVVEALLKAMQLEGPERVFNIGSGRGSSLNDLLAAIELATGLRAERRYQQARVFDVPVSVLSIARARCYLGWEPAVPFDAGLARYVAWLRQVSDRN
jgi:UDP-glucose 4-epimerase